MTTTLALALAFHQSDSIAALDLVHWIADLTVGGPTERPFLIITPTMGECIAERDEMLRILSEAGWTNLYHTNAIHDAKGWPAGPNAMFDAGARWFQEQPADFCRGFLWLEADSIPLSVGWDTAIEIAYFGCGQPFMGNHVFNDKEPTGSHMNGVGVYPRMLCKYAPKCFNQITVPWDMAASSEIVHRLYDTKLIQHAWKCASFDGKGQTLQKRLNPEAVLYHQCKDGSLTRKLRAKFRLHSDTSK